ncbi:hypothetical protein L1887_06122 [Cichorium endivia]|nr:hypothetical protein L1887_06122 [Cichorium endivia]
MVRLPAMPVTILWSFSIKTCINGFRDVFRRDDTNMIPTFVCFCLRLLHVRRPRFLVYTSQMQEQTARRRL